MKKYIIGSLTCLIVSIGFLFLILFCRDSFIIYLGVHATKVLTFVPLVTGGISLFICSGMVTSIAISNKIIAADNQRRQLFVEEQKRLSTSKLAVDKKLDNKTLLKMLHTNISEGWGRDDGQLFFEKIAEQLTDIAEDQQNLDTLLASNGADLLSDTKEVLDQAEQAILKNTRKVLNYMEVAAPEKDADFTMVKGRAEDCFSANAKILHQSQDFLFALTEYLNKQGDDKNDIQMLEIYKKTIMESL